MEQNDRICIDELYVFTEDGKYVGKLIELEYINITDYICPLEYAPTYNPTNDIIYSIS